MPGNLKNALILGYVWPEPRSSAAGERSLQLIEIFQSVGYQVTFASISKVNEAFRELTQSGVQCVPIELNDSSFDQWAKSESFDAVVFDRFITEEQFGWRIAEALPHAIRVLDTQDLHSLRRARQRILSAFKNEQAREETMFEELMDPQLLLTDIRAGNEDVFREVASIYRSDLTLLVSNKEMEYLHGCCEIDPSLLLYLPLGCGEPNPLAGTPSFEERRGFAVIGNFRHPPNADGNRWLKDKIWPSIREILPDAQVSLYGAYPAKGDMDLSDRSQGFLVKGPVTNALQALEGHRVTLAPLRFGAGIKGKIVDSWRAGSPVVTTPVGSEGMELDRLFGGEIANSSKSFAKLAAALYLDHEEWERQRALGRRILNEKFNPDGHGPNLKKALERLENQKKSRLHPTFTARMLASQAFRSTKYFSKWIEEKNLKSPIGSYESSTDPLS